ncbi:MAG: hypothetical protein GXP37_03415 [Chloroflexi bacterium]|nr:hypothetical protein [Chloroflexota bacterium]
MKVFGIGLNKTGTTTLGLCLKQWGFHHKSYDLALLQAVVGGDPAPALAAAERYDSFEDWPWPLLYAELDAHFADALFILTVRKDAEVWLRSLLKHARRTGPTLARQLVYGYDMPHGHEAQHLAFYRAHNQAVRDYFSARPHKCLVVCWETGSGWQELASFLQRPLPDRPLPHANRHWRATWRHWRRRVWGK